MLSTRSSLLVSLAVVGLALTACTTTPPTPPTPPAPPIVMPPPVKVAPPPVAAPVPPPVEAQPPTPAPLMTPTTFSALPGWDRDEVREALPAFLNSCIVLVRRAEWSQVCTAARALNPNDGAAVRAFFENNFVPNLIRAEDGSDSGLITGYYEPLLRGARKRGGEFQTPLYKVPDDLLTVDLASVYPSLKGMRLRGRVVGKKVIPYGTRAEIDRAEINGKELLWVDSAVDAFFLEVQGSGRVALADTGETVRVAFADQNGHPYKAIGRWLVEQGELTVQQATMQGIKGWVEANPTRRQELFNANPSYIFFREERLPDPRIGPKGAMGVPLTPSRSMAIDPKFIPLGAPIFLSTSEAESDVPMQRLMMAQDTGGAIRGAVRGDFFYGFGSEAGDKAGRMKQRGQVWVLMPKPAAR